MYKYKLSNFNTVQYHEVLWRRKLHASAVDLTSEHQCTRPLAVALEIRQTRRPPPGCEVRHKHRVVLSARDWKSRRLLDIWWGRDGGQVDMQGEARIVL